MKRKLTILSVLAAVYLVVSVAPVSAAHVAMVSSNTTASELSNGSLTNAEVERSDAAGYVGHDTYRSSAVARWAFDSGEGSTAYDHVGSLDATFDGQTWTAGKRGSAVDFSGTTGDLSVSDTAGFSSDTITVSFWMKPGDANDGWQSVVDHADGYNAGWLVNYRGEIDEARFEFTGNDGNTHNAAIPVSDGEADDWIHVTAVYDGEKLFAYKNGTLAETTSYSGGINHASVPLQMGAGRHAAFNGALDDVRIYSSALSPGQVSRLHERTNSKLSSQERERWALDAGQGTTAYGDSGGNGQFAGSLTSSDWEADPHAPGHGVNLTQSSDDWIDVEDVSFENETAYTIAWTEDPYDGTGRLTTDRKGNSYWGQLGAVFNDDIRFTTVDGNNHYYDMDVKYGDLGRTSFVFTVYANQTGVLYRNGTLVEKKSMAGHNTSLEIAGIGNPEQQTAGRTLYDFRTYDRALSQEEAQEYSSSVLAQLPETSSYTSADHSATNSVKGYTDLELRNATATVTWSTADGTVLNQTTVSSSGNHTLTWPTSSADNVDVDVEFDPTHHDHTARLHGEGVYAETNAPSVDDSSLSPNSTSSTVGSLPVTLSASVSDPDFGTSQGDSATVEWFVDGEKRGETTVSSNTTVSHELDNVDSGTHDWHVEISDDDGHTDTSATAAFAMPGELKIYNESAPNSLVDSATVNIQFYGGQDGDAFTVQRSTTDGTIDMSGLPADQEFIVVVNSDGYHNRRIYLESLTEQANVYLLPTSSKAVYNVFKLSDKSGTYPAGETRLIIQRGLNVSGDFQWVTVSGDFFGATNEHKTYLRYNQRYRLRVVNADGDTRDLGALSVGDPRTINLVVSGIDQGVEVPPDGVGIATNQTVTGSGASAEKTVEFTFIDESEETTDLSLVVHEAGNASNVFATAGPSPAAFPLGTYKFTQAFSGEAANVTLVANVTYDRSGATETQTLAFGVDQFPLGLPLGEGWASIFGVGFLIVIGGIFSTANARIGALVIPGVALALNVTGILDGVVTIASVGLAFGVAVGINLIQNQGGI